MFTPLALTAIVVPNDISYGEFPPSKQVSPCHPLPHCLPEFLLQLEAAELTCLIRVDADSKSILSNQLPRFVTDISLLDVLEATGEHLDCNQTTTKELYLPCGLAAHKLGVVNHITTRLCFSEIK